MAICGKIVDYISGHKQFDAVSAISILKKISLKIFLRLEQLKHNQRTFGSVDGDFIKSNRTKNTSKMLRYLLGLIYYSNTIFGNISGKNKVTSLYCALKCNVSSFNFHLCTCMLAIL